MVNDCQIMFKEYPNGEWQDWSDYLIELPDINPKVESKNEGEAGVIVYDAAKVSFDYRSISPVYTAFSKELTNVDRYLFRISPKKTDGTFIRRMEGIADFSTIYNPDDQDIIEFDVVGKLSALELLQSKPVKTAGNILPDVNPDSKCDQISFRKFSGVTDINFEYTASSNLVRQTTEENTPDLGDVIQVNFTKDMQSDSNYLGLIKFKYFDSNYSNGRVFYDLVTNIKNWSTETTDNDGTGTADPIKVTNCKWWSNLFLNKDIYIKKYRTDYPLTYYEHPGKVTKLVSGWEITGYDGLKLIEAIIKESWPETIIENRSGYAVKEIPISYFDKLIDENPFGKSPLDALVMIATDFFDSYIYYNRQGTLVIQNRDNLATNGIERSIPNKTFRGGGKKYFWCKLSDAAEVTVIGWEKDDEGNQINGFATALAAEGIKPRNVIKKEVLSDSPVASSKEELDNQANQIANKTLNFYGKRHHQIKKIFPLTDNILEWELCDNVIIGNEKYFIVDMDFRQGDKKVEVEFVSVKSWDYKRSQVHISNSQNKNNSGSSYSGGSNSGSGSSGALPTFGFTLPLKKVGNTVELKCSDNFALKTFGEEQKLDFADHVGLGIEPDAIHRLKVKGKSLFDGDVKIAGNLTILGNIDQENRIDLQVKDKIIALNRDGTNATADGSGIEILGSSNTTISNIKYKDGCWNFSHDINLSPSGKIRINNIEVLSKTRLGDSVIKSNLQKVGIVTTGRWEAQPISALYLKLDSSAFYSNGGYLTSKSITVTSDFGVTGNNFNLGGTLKINTPQDLRVSAAPSFSGLNLFGNTIITGNRYIKNNFFSGIFGGGWIIDLNNSHGSSPYKGSYLEVDNIRVRDSFTTHIFKKDIIRAVNSQVFITDSAVVGRESNSYLYIKQGSLNAIFNVGWVVESRDVDNNGNIKSVKGTITGQATQTLNGVNYNRYTISFTTGYYSYFKVGATVIRRSGSRILLNATNNQKPFMRCYTGNSDTIVTTGIGNLDGISDSELNPVGDGLYGTNAFLKGKIVATSGKIGGCTLGSNSMWLGNKTRNYSNNLLIGKLDNSSNVWHNGVLLGSYNDGRKQLRFSKNNSSGNTVVNISQGSDYTWFGIGDNSGWNIQCGDLKIFDNTRPNVRGIAVLNNKNKEVFRVDTGGTTIIGGFHFSDKGFLISKNGSGIELTLKSTTAITKGFAVFNPSDTKVKCGDAVSGWDWNITAPNKLTVKGNIAASKFSTTYHWNGDANGLYTIIYGGWLKQQDNQFTYKTRSSLTQGVLVHTAHKYGRQFGSAQIGVRNDTGIAYVQLSGSPSILEIYNDQIKIKGLPVLKERYETSIPLTQATDVYTLRNKINAIIGALTHHGLIQQ